MHVERAQRLGSAILCRTTRCGKWATLEPLVDGIIWWLRSTPVDPSGLQSFTTSYWICCVKYGSTAWRKSRVVPPSWRPLLKTVSFSGITISLLELKHSWNSTAALTPSLNNVDQYFLPLLCDVAWPLFSYEVLLGKASKCPPSAVASWPLTLWTSTLAACTRSMSRVPPSTTLCRWQAGEWKMAPNTGLCATPGESRGWVISATRWPRCCTVQWLLNLAFRNRMSGVKGSGCAW